MTAQNYECRREAWLRGVRGMSGWHETLCVQSVADRGASSNLDDSVGAAFFLHHARSLAGQMRGLKTKRPSGGARLGEEASRENLRGCAHVPDLSVAIHRARLATWCA